jgi:DNA-binding XRE family transcriptional regulator
VVVGPFSVKENGDIPVLDYLLSLDTKMRAKAFSEIKKTMKESVMMSKAGAKFSDIKELLMKDEEFKLEYEKLKPRYNVISQIIEARTSQNITQEELAFRVGTQKSNISRLESGTYNPSLDFLAKVARSLGKEVQVILK